jgi:LuxR family maltose regulon positive regulatory protein
MHERVLAGLLGDARALLAALDDERASSGEIRNARAVIWLAEGNPAGALCVLHDVLDGTAPVIAATCTGSGATY